MNEAFMKKAVSLAKKGRGFTSPNPCVGAVVVKNGKIIGEGWHKKAGGDHAEISAVKNALKRLKKSRFDALSGADLYVTLEPCAHVGRTPSCAGALAEAQFGNVFVGMKDPFPKVNGKGMKFLRDAGVNVSVCPPDSKFSLELSLLNQPFLKFIKTKLPHVTLKAGMSLDGKIALKSGESKWITSDIARSDARLERSMCDAVLVGFNTVRLDNPSLSPSVKYSAKKLLKIILDPLLDLDIDLKVFKNPDVFVAYTDSASAKNIKKFKSAGIDIKSFGKTKISLKSLLNYLASSKEIQSVFVEGGSSTSGEFFDEKLIDRVLFYLSPKLIGGVENTPVIGGMGVKTISGATKLSTLNFSKVGEDFKLEGFVSLY